MPCCRILPEIMPNTVAPVSSFTLKVALGNTSVTSPSILNADSCLANGELYPS